MPEVNTCVSSIASSMNRLLAFAKMLSLMSTPSIRNTLSKANAPPIWSCPVFGVLSVRFGAISATSCGVRPTGRMSTSAFR